MTAYRDPEPDEQVVGDEPRLISLLPVEVQSYWRQVAVDDKFTTPRWYNSHVSFLAAELAYHQNERLCAALKELVDVLRARLEP